MSKNNKQHSRACRSIAGFAVLCIGVASAAHAQSTCLPIPDADLQGIQSLIASQPRKALEELQVKIAELRLAPQPDPRRLASLYALQARSHEVLELDAQALSEASEGLALVPELDDPLHLDLLITAEQNIYGEHALQGAVASIEAAREAQRPDSLADTCLLITLGLLQMRSNHAERAIVDLTQAYRTSAAQGQEDARVLAADSLSSVMGLLGDYDEALALNQEAVDWATAHDAPMSLSVAMFTRGKLYRVMREFEAARTEQVRSREISVRLGDTQGIAYADLELCRIDIELGDLAAARPLCDSALQAFTDVHATDIAKEAMAYLARIDVEERRPERALAIFNRVLDQQGTDMYAPRATLAYLWRSRANAALARDRDAYRDLAEYTRRITEQDDARRSSSAAALRVKFEMHGKDQDLERARSEAAAARTEVSRRAFERNLVALCAALLVFTVLSSTWLWRRRKQTDDMRRAAEDRLELIGRLTGGVAHEFNNLMTVIQQAIGLLAARETIAADRVARGLVAEVQQASNVCADVTTQLLSFARQQNLKPETFSVDEFLSSLVPALRIAEGPTVDFKVICDEPGLLIHADARQFKAVLLHLVGNARDAMVHGGPITIRALGESGRCVRIDIVDEGGGMSAETLAHAVEPFFTTKQVGAGSGLGLSVADGFMRQSGGTMTLESTPGVGTTVRLRFPRARQVS